MMLTTETRIVEKTNVLLSNSQRVMSENADTVVYSASLRSSLV